MISGDRNFVRREECSGAWGIDLDSSVHKSVLLVFRKVLGSIPGLVAHFSSPVTFAQYILYIDTCIGLGLKCTVGPYLLFVYMYFD